MNYVPAREPDPFDPMIGIRAPLRVTLSVNTRWSLAWIRAMRGVAYVIGPHRAIRLARWGGLRLIRIRFDDGSWRWLRPEDTDCCDEAAS